MSNPFGPDVDPCCPENCNDCAHLPYGESVRLEQRAMMAAAIKAQAIYSRIMTETEKTPKELYELRDMATAAMCYGHALASVIGLLLKEAPDLAHRAVAIHQDMYSNGDVHYTGELYEQIEADNAAKAFGAVATTLTPAVDSLDQFGTPPLPLHEINSEVSP